ncbi:MAG: MFS transporter [Burkholderiales bacterium]|nr:MFS transporter [Burkholderiales bacterium]
MPIKPASPLNPGVSKREVWAWAMYDFANSGFTTVVITAVYSAYFVAVVAGKAVWASFVWSAALSVSYLAILLSAPLLGAYADLHGAKKRLLALTTLGCVLGTAALALPGAGDIALAVTIIALSNYFFGSGENLIAAFLPELARGRALGRVSGWGWGLGYLGGIVSLGVALAYIGHIQTIGGGAPEFVPGVMLLTAGLFALFALPTFLILRERAIHRPLQSISTRSAYSRVMESLTHARQYQDLARFLLCIVFYQAGIMTVITLAAVYAQQAMHFTMHQTIEMILVVNLTAALGALAFGYVQDKLGHKLSLALTLIGWLVMVGLAYTATTPGRFWLAANIAGLCLGASQSAGRALVGYLSPKSRRAEFFGLWGLAVKLASILGPMTYGAVVWITGGNHRMGMLLTGIYFVIGLIVLAAIDVKRGRRAALKRQL